MLGIYHPTHREACWIYTTLYTPREATLGIKTSHIHTQGGYPRINPCIYTPREATLGINPVYTPQGGYPRDKPPYIHLREATLGINLPIYTLRYTRVGVPAVYTLRYTRVGVPAVYMPPYWFIGRLSTLGTKEATTLEKRH